MPLNHDAAGSISEPTEFCAVDKRSLHSAVGAELLGLVDHPGLGHDPHSCCASRPSAKRGRKAIPTVSVDR